MDRRVLTDASINLANFSDTIGHNLTKAQFYTTADYKANNLNSIILSNNDLSGWNFANFKLTNVDFSNSALTGADYPGPGNRAPTSRIRPSSVSLPHSFTRQPVMLLTI